MNRNCWTILIKARLRHEKKERDGHALICFLLPPLCCRLSEPNERPLAPNDQIYLFTCHLPGQLEVE